MSVEEANSHLPESTSMLDAFAIPARDHFTIGKTAEEMSRVPFEKLGAAAADFFTAGVAYLANRGHDKYMQEVGTTAWWTVNQQSAMLAFTPDVALTSIQLGVPPEVVLNSGMQNDVPYVFFAQTNGPVARQIAYVLIPPEFLLQAQTQPVEALGTIAWICSQLRDLTNGRLAIDGQHITPRAYATEAHLLKEAAARHPEIVLSEKAQHLLTNFPDGIQSERLPREALYRGVSGTEFKNAPYN